MTKTQESPAEVASATDTFALVHPGLIVPDPNNVRDELTDIDDLAASIFQLGLQQPLRVRFVPSGFLEHDPTCAVYVVIAGHRRLAALRSLMERDMWSGDVPCMIAPENTSADDVTAAMLVENLQRSDLNPVEEGHAFERLTKEYRYKRADLAIKIGRSESYIGDRLALVKLPQCILDSVAAGHYPMTQALLLKGVPVKVVEEITKGGRRIADQYSIDTAVRNAKYTELKAAFEKALQTNGIERVVTDRFEFVRDSEQIAVFTTLDDAKTLAKYEAPKGTKAVMEDRPYNGTVSVELRRQLTPKQLEKRNAELEAARTEEQRERAERDRQRYEAERANWSPAKQAWADRCDVLKAEHVEATREHEAAIEAAELEWAAKADTKLVAKWAMLAVVAWTDSWSLHGIAQRLGIECHTLNLHEKVGDWAAGDGKRFSQLVAMCLVADADEYGDEGGGAAKFDQQQYVAKLGIPDVEELVLPDEPSDDDPTDTDPNEEAPADDPIHDVA